MSPMASLTANVPSNEPVRLMRRSDGRSAGACVEGYFHCAGGATSRRYWLGATTGKL